MPEWNLDSIIGTEDQAEIQKLTVRQQTQKRFGRFLCRIGWHRKTVWSHVGQIQMCNVRPDGKEIPWEFVVNMRCCTQCQIPDVQIVRA